MPKTHTKYVTGSDWAKLFRILVHTERVGGEEEGKIFVEEAFQNLDAWQVPGTCQTSARHIPGIRQVLAR
jgi:hypothetical protein